MSSPSRRRSGQFCVEVFFFRNWQNWGNRAYFPKGRQVDERGGSAHRLPSCSSIPTRPPPKQILLSHESPEREVVAAALAVRAGHKVDVATPKRGERRQIVREMPSAIAKEAIGRRLSETASQQRLLDLTADALGLARSPRRIEVYDNSHIQGANAGGRDDRRRRRRLP